MQRNFLCIICSNLRDKKGTREKFFSMRKCFLVLVFALCASAASAQMTKENSYGIKNLRFEYRGDFDCFNDDNETYSGFTGRYLNFILAGDITDNLYYAYRQRINKIQKEYNFFDATDYLYFGWRITKNISWTVGKEIIAMGGIEYDLAPIDVYFHSQFWDNINCYRFGTNIEYTTNDRKNTFTFQFSNSPCDNNVIYGSLYNYSLHWRANYKHFGPVWSVNMFEYKKGCFLNVIALGTSFNFGPVAGYFDFTNRANGEQEQFFFKDMTIIGRIGYNFMHNKFQVFLKTGYDVNDAQLANLNIKDVFDRCVLPGTDVRFYGGGFEFYPWQGKNDIRIHGFFAVSDVSGTVEVVDETLQPAIKDEISYQVNIGVTWRLKFIDK